MWNRFRAPTTLPRRRIGRACTEWKPSASALAGEPGPAAIGAGQVLIHDWLARVVAVEARAFLGLQFEQLQHAHGFARGGHDPQVAIRCDQHESCRADVKDLDATVGQQCQQLDDIELSDKCVGQLHECSGEYRFSRHRNSSHHGSS